MTKKDFLNALVAGLSRAMGTKEMAELRDYYAELARARRESPLLRGGDAAFASWGEDVVLILRYGAEGARLIAVNRGSEEATLRPAARSFRPLHDRDIAALGELPSFTVPAMGCVTLDLPFKV